MSSHLLSLLLLVLASRAGASEQDDTALPRGVPFVEIPVNAGDMGLDKIQVVSSALRILPRSNTERRLPHNNIRKREAVQSWRRSRQHQFVTNTVDRLSPPAIARVYPPVDSLLDRGFRKTQRRIIYYADLPEIVRPPTQWYPAAPPYSPLADNDITRVQSSIIDVTSSRYNPYPSGSSPPRFTIIDVDPPHTYSGYRQRPHYAPYPTPSRFYDVRTPPYRDYATPTQYFRPEVSLEPVKLTLPTSDRPYSTTNINSTDSPANTTRFLPDNLPASLQALSKFVT